MASYVITRSLFAKKQTAVSGSAPVNNVALADGSEIQVFLKQILEQTSKLESVSLNKMSAKDKSEVESAGAEFEEEICSRGKKN